MARIAFGTGIWVLAATLGVLGYQALTLYFYQDWPSVSLGFAVHELREGWDALFGGFWFIPDRYVAEIPAGGVRDTLTWIARLPVAAAGIALSYGLFLLADSMREREDRVAG